jgi:GTP:adenosylcobinamide-phosphate guanylyltransferase
MDAIVIAGGTPKPEELLYPLTQGKPKAMLEIAGKPMIQWVLDALDGAAGIENVIVVGLENETGFSSAKISARLESQGDILPNIRHGVDAAYRLNPNTGHVAVVSSDIPGIRAEHVDWVVNAALETDEDAYYNIIRREVMEARYPSSKRSYVRLRDMEVCGGDLNILRASLVQNNEALWDRIIASRKSALKQAALLGYDTLFLLMFRLITMKDAERRVTRRLNLSGRALVCPYAEIGMDVDKPHQYEMMCEDLSRQSASPVRVA